MNRIMEIKPELYKVSLNWHGEDKEYYKWSTSKSQAFHYATRELGRELNKSAHNIRNYFLCGNMNNYTVELVNIKKTKEVISDENKNEINSSNSSNRTIDSQSSLDLTDASEKEGINTGGNEAVLVPMG